AYYYSEVMYRGLCNVFALATFNSPKDITTPRVEEKLSKAYSLTLGQLLLDMEGLLPSELHRRCTFALEQRNFLAHHYWFDRSPLMFRTEGLLGMEKELHEMAAEFSTLDDDVMNYFQPILQNLGVTNDLMEKTFTQLVDGNLEKPL